MKLLSRLDWLFSKVSRAMFAFAGLLIVFDMIIVSIDVVMRNSNIPSILWINEVTEFTLLFITFLGVAWVLRRGEHIRFDFLLTKLSKNIGGLYLAIIRGLSALVLLVIAYFGILLTADAIVSKDIVYTLLEPPKWIFMAVIAFGSLLFGLEFVRSMVIQLQEWQITRNQKNTPRGA